VATPAAALLSARASRDDSLRRDCKRSALDGQNVTPANFRISVRSVAAAISSRISKINRRRRIVETADCRGRSPVDFCVLPFAIEDSSN
jgi:hypothetical protein